MDWTKATGMKSGLPLATLVATLATVPGAGAQELVGVLVHPGQPRAFLGSAPPVEQHRALHAGTVAESHFAGNYVYIRAVCDAGETWVAAPRQDAPPGTAIRWADGVEMKGFHSMKLNRTFAAIQFVDAVDLGD